MNTLGKDKLELRVPSKPEYVSVVRALVTDVARRISFSETAVEDLQVAVSEACANVVQHAYDGRDAEMIVSCSLQDNRLIMEISDSGVGCVESEPNAPDLEQAGGLGLFLIRSLMDQVSLNSSPNCGTVVRMVKKPRSRRRSPNHPLL